MKKLERTKNYKAAEKNKTKHPPSLIVLHQGINSTPGMFAGNPGLGAENAARRQDKLSKCHDLMIIPGR